MKKLIIYFFLAIMFGSCQNKSKSEFSKSEKSELRKSQASLIMAVYKKGYTNGANAVIDELNKNGECSEKFLNKKFQKDSLKFDCWINAFNLNK